MRRLRTAIRFAPVLAAALFWVVVVRIGLWLVPHRWLRRALMPADARRSAGLPPLRVVWAVRHAARLVPGATCLTQALAAQVMLSRRGTASTLMLGIDPDRGPRFEAHAWLELGGRAVLGGTDASLARHARLATFPEEPA